MKDWPQGTVFVNRVDSSDLAMVNPRGLSGIWEIKKLVRYMSLGFLGRDVTEIQAWVLLV